MYLYSYLFKSTGNHVAFSTSSTPDPNHPSQVNFDTDSFIIGVDNHASRTLSNNKRHFIGYIRRLDNVFINGINGKLPICGIGTIQWKIEDDDGKVHAIRIPNTFYVPQLEHCILSPQHWAQEANDHFPLIHGITSTTQARSEVLRWSQGKYQRTVMMDPDTNTPRFRSAAGTIRYRAFEAEFHRLNKPTHANHHSHCQCRHVCNRMEHRPYVNPIMKPQAHQPHLTEDNLSDYVNQKLNSKRVLEDLQVTDVDDLQSELMTWHHRLGHCSFRILRALAVFGIIPKKLSTIRPPKCATCLYGSMTKRPWRTKAMSNRVKVRQVTQPGDCVSVDQMQSTLPGFMGQLKGRLTKKRYNCATVFVDHHSRLTYIHLQESLSSEHTLQAKHAFEAFCNKHHVIVSHYHADNGRFADNMFLSDIKNRSQTISFCGVNAHFQNGIAEKKIRDMTEMARKQLLHAKARWPTAIHLSLWPYAIRNAAYVYNNMPNTHHDISPIEVFSRSEVSPNLKHHHTFGCPVFALNNALQSGKSQPRWTSRARVGINLGHSPRHSPSVSLVLNTDTGLVSPQYHVQFDELFDSLRKSQAQAQPFSQWQFNAGLRDVQQNKHDIFKYDNVSDPLSSHTYERTREDTNQPITAPSAPTNDSNADSNNFTTTAPEQDVFDNPTSELPSPVEPTATPSPPYHTMRGSFSEPPPAINPAPSRFGRVRRFTPRMQAYQEQINSANLAVYEERDDTAIFDDPMQFHPVAMAATSNPDTMYFDQGMRQPDSEQFVHAVIKEVNDHISRKHWELVPRSAVPKDVAILPSVWSLKRKRDIKSRQVYKWKARLNVHGGRQVHGINYWETFSPVVTWITIRILLILTILNKWYSRQVDFVLAFPQAKIETDMYMELPRGIEMAHGNGKTHVLKLLKNLYGQKQAGRIWNLHLKDKLLKIGFTQSKFDECLFYRGDVMFVVYVDDGIFVSPSDQHITDAINELKQQKLDIEDQGDLNDYLGVNVTTLKNGDIKLSQPHLIEQIIDESKVNLKLSMKQTPANSSKILTPDLEGQNFNGKFNYRSIIGRLNFLEKSTRPDLAYAVHQCARFSANPKVSHGKAIEHIVHYLRNTKDDGIILKPDSDKAIEAYADADFAGNWNKVEAPFDSNTARSRTGYLITFLGCPITWCSKLQTTIALSSTEAEYVALSHSMRDVIPMMGLLKEMKHFGFDVRTTDPRIHCKAFEDNMGAIELSKLPKLRPRTKHINIVYHHFREFVTNELIKIFPIRTEDQQADIFTKPLPQNLFLKLRKRISGF